MPHISDLPPQLKRYVELAGRVRLTDALADVLGTKEAEVVAWHGRATRGFLLVVPGQIAEIKYRDADGLPCRDWVSIEDLEVFSGNECYIAITKGIPPPVLTRQPARSA